MQAKGIFEENSQTGKDYCEAVDKQNQAYKFLLTFGAKECVAFSGENPIATVITTNIPSAWSKDYRLANLHLKTQIKDIIGTLTNIEEQVEIRPTTNQVQQNKKNIKIPCRLHHENH